MTTIMFNMLGHLSIKILVCSMIRICQRQNLNMSFTLHEMHDSMRNFAYTADNILGIIHFFKSTNQFVNNANDCSNINLVKSFLFNDNDQHRNCSILLH